MIMGLSLLTTIVSLTLISGAVTAPPDTVHQYVIDRSYVPDFDGTQLVGKSIVSYQIVTAPSDKNNSIIKMHVINTSSIEKPLIFVDNIGYTPEEYDKIKASLAGKIKSISVYRGVKEGIDMPVSAKNIELIKKNLDNSRSIIVIETKNNK